MCALGSHACVLVFWRLLFFAYTFDDSLYLSMSIYNKLSTGCWLCLIFVCKCFFVFFEINEVKQIEKRKKYCCWLIFICISIVISVECLKSNCKSYRSTNGKSIQRNSSTYTYSLVFIKIVSTYWPIELNKENWEQHVAVECGAFLRQIIILLCCLVQTPI